MMTKNVLAEWNLNGICHFSSSLLFLGEAIRCAPKRLPSGNLKDSIPGKDIYEEINKLK